MPCPEDTSRADRHRRRPRAPYNAIRLHSFLASVSMAERDAYWGIETFPKLR